MHAVDVRGEGAALDDSGWSPLGITHDQGNLMVRSCKKVLDIFGGAKGEERTMGLRFECHNAVPAQRGLGSSSSALVLGMAAGLALCGRELYTPTSKKLLLQLAADEEGHADNIAAAIYGGMQVNFRASSTGRHGAGQWITQRVRLPRGLHCVLFIPDEKHVLRDAARATLPENYSRTDAVHNLGRTAMLISSFASGQFDALRFAMEDRIHQPYRRVLFPFEFLIDAALAAGAHGAFLSSQGPTVVAICGSSTGPEIGSDTMAQFLAEAVSVAMTTEAERRGFSGETHIATPCGDS
jgi:homoserine kinase